MTAMNAASAFRAAVEARDPDAMEATLAPGVVFHSPAVFRPYTGRDKVAALLRIVAVTFEDFTYTDELLASGGAAEALIFRARVGERDLEGMDLLRFDADGLIADLTVMIRPLSGLLALAQAMGPKVEAAGLKAG
jgi:hypothetical protein